ncbi:hypothetical protein JW813_09025 [Clostridium botulinum]|uniref:hypothetical protein n=1 Tax=Clostridium botulinum TaxID=1491 RepID=UPI0013F0805C|nr:hypothetical protein [Clostridium botulinum]NFG25188.1 hypothetical protein [Clostridium botulinum]NFO04025.1 hypothetical protein [Clostridium botulinum]NFR14817.1 hypothetical protein [Clostridium botulinum]NFR44973.1 hypothetical protein [Clostridium botulinum]UZP01880.1 hypothetical protein JW813_09025 [Clostridium botulinum]
MDILLILYIVLSLIGIGFIFLNFYKNGMYIKNKFVFGIMIAFIGIIFLLYITSLPSNYIFQRSIGIFGLILTISDIFVSNKNFNLSRIVSTVLILSSFFLLLS